MKKLEEQIYAVLRSRRYNRATPYLPDNICSAIEYFVKKNQPIDLVGFWGVGPKSAADSNDEATGKFLQDLNSEIQRVYLPGLNYTFIFADMHGLHNGYDESTIKSYIESIKELFSKYDFNFIRLSDLWGHHGITFEKIRQNYLKQDEGWWSKIEHHKTIEQNAKNRNIHLNPVEAAQKYFVMRDMEKPMLEKEFPHSIFHAFSDPKLKNVLPNMPTLYLYAKPGWSNTPWFTVS